MCDFDDVDFARAWMEIVLWEDLLCLCVGIGKQVEKEIWEKNIWFHFYLFTAVSGQYSTA